MRLKQSIINGIKMTDKPHLNLIVAGHVDQGKSTIIGHLLVSLKIIDERTIQKYAEESEKTGKGDTFKYAWVMDNLKDERERGVTIDLAFQRFESKKFDFTLIDAPGHRDFIKNMITGASEADCAILVVSAKPGETEIAIGVGGQSREHCFLLKTLGVKQMIIALNKMDDAQVKYSEERFNEVKSQVSGLLKQVGFSIDKTPILPVSGWKGDNLIEKGNLGWHKGPTIYEALDSFEIEAPPVDKPLRLPLQDVYSITGVGTVPVGRVETGTFKVGDTVSIMPGNHLAEVKSIETHHTPIQEAKAGDNIGFNLRGIDKGTIRRGDVIGSKDNPATVVKEMTAQIIVVHYPTAIAPGYTPVIHAHTAQAAATITELISKLDPRTGAPLEEKPKSLKTGDAAIVKIQPLRPLCIETFKEFPELGRFALRDMGTTIAAGVVKEINAEWTD